MNKIALVAALAIVLVGGIVIIKSPKVVGASYVPTPTEEFVPKAYIKIEPFEVKEVR
jgi:hypothetical protein